MGGQPASRQMTGQAARGTGCGINAANSRSADQQKEAARVVQTFKFGAGLQKPMVTGLLAAVWIMLVPSAVSAHMVAPQMGGVASGFLHPLTGPDHFLAMFAVGLWGAQMGSSQAWRLAITSR